MEIMWCSVFGAILLFIIIRIGIPFFLILYHFLIAARDLHNIKRLKRNSDEWAVITGGTDGIGKCYAHELAKIGFNVCIISRSLEKLEQVSKELEAINNKKAKVIVADFTKTDIYQKLREEFKLMKVAVLVNNVGMTQPYPCELWKLPVNDAFYVDFAHCNMTSAIMVTRCGLSEGGMLNSGHGLIINVSSASAMYPLPLGGMYASTKVFLDFLSRGMAYELRKSNIKVQTVLPFYVLTKFIGKFRPPKFLAPTPEAYVKSALSMVGIEDRTHGTLSHALQGLVMSQPPEWIRRRAALILNSYRAKLSRN